jgi:hypothetical protein
MPVAAEFGPTCSVYDMVHFHERGVMNGGGHERPVATGTPQEDLHRPETEYFGIVSDSSDEMCAFGGQVAPLHRARHSFADGHDPYHILSDDSVEQLILDNMLDGYDYGFPADVVRLAFNCATPSLKAES